MPQIKVQSVTQHLLLVEVFHALLKWRHYRATGVAKVRVEPLLIMGG